MGDYDFQNLRGQVLSTSDIPTGIDDLRYDHKNTVRYYDLNGRYIGTSLDNAPEGVYVGSDGTKVRK